MKHPKTISPYIFKDLSHQDVVDILNRSYPINIKYNEELVNRVYKRYPFIKKSEVSLIIKTVFQSFRELLVLGKVLNFNSFLFDMKLHFYSYLKKGVILPAIKVKISTPPPIRKL
jgi:hypothetical protein